MVSLDISQRYGPLWPVTRIALPFFTCIESIFYLIAITFQNECVVLLNPKCSLEMVGFSLGLSICPDYFTSVSLGFQGLMPLKKTPVASVRLS